MKIIYQCIHTIAKVNLHRFLIENHFTLNPDAASKLYKALKPKKGFSGKCEFIEILSPAFSFFDLDQAFEVLKP